MFIFNKNLVASKKRIVLTYLFLTLIFLLLMKIDYRFINQIQCCGDDYDYYLHAETIAINKNLSYEDQVLGDYAYRNNGKVAPVGFFGSGLLAAPFLYMGELFFKYFENSDIDLLMNFKILFYSLSSIFYFFLSIFISHISLKSLNIKFNPLILLAIYLSSGLQYYAFERYSMTHVYEVFGISLTIFLSLKFFKDNNKLSLFLIPISIYLNLLIRMSNIFVILVPLFIKLTLKSNNLHNKNHKFLNSKYFYFGFLIGTSIYFYISFTLFGEIIFNPRKIYAPELSNYEVIGTTVDFGSLILSILNSFKIIFFSLEFGLLWTNPILLIVVFSACLKIKNQENKLLIISFLQLFFLVFIWQSTASSYGFRYLYPLLPVAIIHYYINFSNKSRLNKVFLVFCFISFLQYLFFETHPMTQLSTEYVINSFGNNVIYSAPKYVLGVGNAFLDINSYLNIVSTSFLGAIIFKIILSIVGQDKLLILLDNFGLPVGNENFINLLSSLKEIAGFKFFIVYFYISIFSYLIIKIKQKL